uniref:Zinc/manganese transport system permease protein n=1 Tax=Candidatus Kentrum sp. FM TaxID=2126340 RepID=A0A450SXN1_9GAMM|nr:MAG: zinc/manganese transport system permease protein [Candidatus Kentron sp. FM]VFJ58816.1 MAG: zinc/manganese transport system permease protein [Candidatus Kentron sp. FM]VFK11551.1 MAG: zinc/manganese transport system permease protein [Candidatus Kentron sp. FM]
MTSIVGPALAAGLMIALTHAPLGIEVLKRGIIFIDLAVAQVAGLGLVAAEILLHEPLPWSMQTLALACAVAAGLFFRKIEKVMPEHQEALIGVSFVLAASLAILLLADHPHGGREIQYLLSGQMLFVTWTDVIHHAPIYGAILAAWFLKPVLRNGLGFYLIFALAITSSVQLVGVYVVFASLILPALAAVKSGRPHITAWLCGILSVTMGIALSVLTDLPTGPVLVTSFTVTAIVLSNLYKFWLLSDSGLIDGMRKHSVTEPQPKIGTTKNN